MLKKRDAWIISILVLVSILSIIYINSFDVGLAPKKSGSAGPQSKVCIMPLSYPQLINQSGKICSGSYNFGIGIGADDIKITCDSNTQFSGAIWNGLNGLTISGLYNVTVEGCKFISFAGDGIYVGNVTNYTAEINLLNISSNYNDKNGVHVGYNLVNLNLSDSDISYNNKDGIILTSNYFGPVNVSNGTGKVFPRGTHFFNNKIVENRGNGINFDAFDYWEYLPNIEFSFLLNDSVEIVGNNLSNNGKNGIQNIGFIGDSFYPNVRTSIILRNSINNNGHSGLYLRVAKSDKIISSGSYNLPLVASFSHVFFNDLTKNRLDGISLYTPKFVTVPITGLQTSVSQKYIFANFIKENNRYGVSSTYEEYLPEFVFHGLSDFFLIQNVINNNYQEGVFSKGLYNGTNNVIKTSISQRLYCNDIVYNGLGNKDGVSVDNFYWQTANLDNSNIIDSNLRGVYIGSNINPVGNFIRMNENYIGFNSIGLLIKGATSLSSNITYNDFDNNPNLQAFDANKTEFSRNWWSDYSPGCVDANRDGWCDFPRPIPFANQDILPKAGNLWGWKDRGYFVKANTGVILKETCYVPSLPEPPIITPPPRRKGTGNETGGIRIPDD